MVYTLREQGRILVFEKHILRIFEPMEEKVTRMEKIISLPMENCINCITCHILLGVQSNSYGMGKTEERSKNEEMRNEYRP